MDGRPHAPESAGCGYAGAAVEVVPPGAAKRSHDDMRDEPEKVTR